MRETAHCPECDRELHEYELLSWGICIHCQAENYPDKQTFWATVWICVVFVVLFVGGLAFVAFERL